MKLGESKVTQNVAGLWVVLEDGNTLMMDLLDQRSPSPWVGDTVAYYSEGSAAVTRFEVIVRAALKATP